MEKPCMGASRLSTSRRSTAPRKPTDEVATVPVGTAPTVRRARAGSAAMPPPLVLDRYRLITRLGAGAFGVVWMAHDERLDRQVAVKMLPRERVIGGRFEREARAAARLVHPGIVTLFEAAVDDEGAYLVSELIRGQTLHALLEEGRLSDRDVVAIAVSLCEALAHAHAEGVIHRDVKPSNILVPDRPSSPAHPAKLTDFGVARVIGGDSLTRTGDVVGTAAYMAPEQAEGLQAGGPADLYALALVTYEALTGVNPVRTSTAASRARRLGAHLPPLRRQRRDLPRELGYGIDLALRPRSRERGEVDELRHTLASVLPTLDDTPGLVAAPRLRLRRAAHDTEAREPSELRVAAGGNLAAREDTDAPSEHRQRPDGMRVPPGLPPGEEFDVPPASLRLRWVTRGLSAVAAGASCAWCSAHVVGTPGPAQLAGAIAAMAVLFMPRLGWIAMTLGLVLAAALGGSPGGALLLAVLLAPAFVLARSGRFWGLGVGAPALGLLGLAAAWPALAALSSRGPWRRAALGALGWLWLLAAAQISPAGLHAHPSANAVPFSVWGTSFAGAWHTVLAPLARSGLLAPAALWALAAVVLPWLRRRSSPLADGMVVLAFSALLLILTRALIGHETGSAGLATPAVTVLGAIAGGVFAWLPSLLSRHSSSTRTPGPEAELA